MNETLKTIRIREINPDLRKITVVPDRAKGGRIDTNEALKQSGYIYAYSQ
jgi:hypothetical protein